MEVDGREHVTDTWFNEELNINFNNYYIDTGFDSLVLEIEDDKGIEDERSVSLFCQALCKLPLDTFSMYIFCSTKALRLFIVPKNHGRWKKVMEYYKKQLSPILCVINCSRKSIRICSFKNAPTILIDTIVNVSFLSKCMIMVLGDEFLANYLRINRIGFTVTTSNAYSNSLNLGMYPKVSRKMRVPVTAAAAAAAPPPPPSPSDINEIFYSDMEHVA